MSVDDSQRPKYPQTRRDPVVGDYHGTMVPDPYRWLELDTMETRNWLTAQGGYTRQFLDALPQRDRLLSRLRRLWQSPKYGVPFKAGGSYFSWIADPDPEAALQDQPILYRQATLDGPLDPVLDPSTFARYPAVAVTYQEPSPDGCLLVYALSFQGSDWQELHIRNLRTGQDYPETLCHCKFVGVGWAPDSSGFYYSRYPAPEEVDEPNRHNYSRVCWHSLGMPQAADLLVAASLEDKSTNLHPIATSDGAYLLLHLWNNGDPHGRLLYRPMGSVGPFLPLLEGADAHFNVVDSSGDIVLIQTDLEAPNGRIIAVDLAAPADRRWHTVVGEGPDSIAFAGMVNDLLLVVYLHHACHRGVLYRLDGTPERELPLPPYSTITGLWGRQGEPELFLCLESFLIPPALYRYEACRHEMTPLRAPRMCFDGAAFETRQVFYPARDGTSIPVFLTQRKNLQLDGEHPLVLYGYGGFGTSVPPLFWLSMAPWLEVGGIFAVANIRGGGEYGAGWHRAGVRERKQTSFDDFIDAAEWLIAQRYTSPARLAIIGASNGGLLVAGCLVQRPDLYAAAISQVPITDMVRYHHFTVGQHLTAEFGTAEDSPDSFKVLYAYSPLHNVRNGVAYPFVMVTTADHDDRALPLHAMKFVAALQAADPAGTSHLLRVEPGAGHGIGKPASRQIEEMADILGFLCHALRVEPSSRSCPGVDRTAESH